MPHTEQEYIEFCAEIKEDYDRILNLYKNEKIEDEKRISSLQQQNIKLKEKNDANIWSKTKKKLMKIGIWKKSKN
tara:strand:- start:361 stop:585 length:225 start_codon:yes stop_codon:yes gene_type:complete